MKYLALVLCVLFCFCNENTNYVRDGKGRIVLYHGVNVSSESKDPPFGPKIDSADFVKIKELGFNLVRYIMLWEAVESQQNVYDTVYMINTEKWLKQLRSLGIDVVIDFHQDLYARKFTGNGFPEWTVNDSGIPFHQRTPWNLNYLEPAVIASFTNFWKSDSLKKKYIDAVEYVLKRFDTLVIGVDPINEPFPGVDIKFEQKTLTDFYTKVQSMIVKNGFKSRIFFEPWMCTSAGIPSFLKFKPDSDDVYYPHFYDALVHEGKPYTDLNKIAMYLSVSQKILEANKFGVPIAYGEFAISGDLQKYLGYLHDFLYLADSLFFGWTYYSYDTYTKDNFDSILGHLVRVYPQRIAGDNPVMKYDSCSFKMTFDSKGSRDSTEIFIPLKLNNVVIRVSGTEVLYQGTIFKYVADSGKQNVEITWE